MINENGVFIMETKDGYYLSYEVSGSDDMEFSLSIEKSKLKEFLKEIKKKSLEKVDMCDLLYDME
jgi:hypothetical protein